MTLPTATIRTTPDDFVVEELPLYEPAGAGSHLYVRFRKRGLETFAVVRALAQKLGAPLRESGTAGLKDRHAVTEQTASFPWAESKPLPELASLASEGVEILSLARHGNKLRTGHLKGNRFSLVLRDLDEARVPEVLAAFERIGTEGIPNWFGSQRFGRFGDNVEVALAWMRGEKRPPNDPKVRRLHLSAVQSELFHRVLARRIEDGTWTTVLTGDLVSPRHTQKTFVCNDDPVERERAARGEQSATGPLFGVKMRWPEGATATLEREILGSIPDAEALFAKWSSLGEGARRALRVVPEGLHASSENGVPGSVRVVFVLPSGAYATSVVGAVCELRDATRPGPTPPEEQGPAETEGN